MLYGNTQHNPPSRFLSEIDVDFQPDNTFGMSGGFLSDMKNSFKNSYDDFDQTPRYDEPATGLASSAASDEPRYVPDLNEGDAVRHQIFGQGTVVELDGDNATIYFKGKGPKKLNIAFAPLEKL
jgi:DNA helicase-2/ATP-dependent DNA helicase PcrA